MLAFLSILLLILRFVLKTRAKRETGRTDICRSEPLETTRLGTDSRRTTRECDRCVGAVAVRQRRVTEVELQVPTYTASAAAWVVTRRT